MQLSHPGLNLPMKSFPQTTVYPKKYAHGFCFAVLCCGYILTDFTISIRLTSLALWQSNDCPSVSKVTLMNMDKYFMWIHYERLHNHNKAKHNKTVCIFLGIYCMQSWPLCVDFVALVILAVASMIPSPKEIRKRIALMHVHQNRWMPTGQMSGLNMCGAQSSNALQEVDYVTGY